MLSRKRIAAKLFIIIFAAVCIIAALTGATPAGSELYLGGFPAGFVLETSNVEVVGMCEIMTAEGLRSPAREAGIVAGDKIRSINGMPITSGTQVTEMLSGNLKKAVIDIERGGESCEVEVTPVKDITSGKMRVGILIRDSLSGVGTVTYIDASAGKFASLGHPVTDGDGKISPINGGKIYSCVIYDVKRGVRGTPGELKGAFENNKLMGSAKVNCSSGVFGDMAEGYDYSSLTPVKAGKIDDVSIGRAEIYSTVSSNKREKYDISIVKVDKNNGDNRNFVIKIEDADLISKTGGIVQGMSGSPIVQNGKLIGAVTHVFINDPTRGFGISIENMMSAY